MIHTYEGALAKPSISHTAVEAFGVHTSNWLAELNIDQRDLVSICQCKQNFRDAVRVKVATEQVT